MPTADRITVSDRTRRQDLLLCPIYSIQNKANWTVFQHLLAQFSKHSKKYACKQVWRKPDCALFCLFLGLCVSDCDLGIYIAHIQNTGSRQSSRVNGTAQKHYWTRGNVTTLPVIISHDFCLPDLWKRKREACSSAAGQSEDCFIIPEWANLPMKKNQVPFSM